MADNNYFSPIVSVFHERTTPEEGHLVGYAVLIDHYSLKVPLPDRLAIISEKHKRYETEEWSVFTPRYKPEESLFGHLTFAIKYEGIDLGVIKALFEKTGKQEITDLVLKEPTGIYSRKIWFLYEWLMGEALLIADLKIGNFTELVDEKVQYPGSAENSKRHKIRNNLPGVRDFCPLIRRTEKLDAFINARLNDKATAVIGKVHSDVLARAAAFLLLKDSKASYAIEGERPPQNRAQRWARAIGQAGQKPLSKNELLRLQQIVIDDSRFTKMGWRTEGGFVGEHDRSTNTPLPDHISAKWQDIDKLVNGLIAVDDKLGKSEYNAVLAATTIAFGFVFIHPFVDGNGRIHRYLIHHVLENNGFVSKGIVFPVSSVILERLEEYRKVLEAYSFPRLDLIDWKPTLGNNVEVKNETIDLYRYFDATKQAEFLYSCIAQTIEKTLPEEVDYLNHYDHMKAFIEEHFEMPDRTVALLVRFLEQNGGKLSARARSKEFAALNENEAETIERKYHEIFGS